MTPEPAKPYTAAEVRKLVGPENALHAAGNIDTFSQMVRGDVPTPPEVLDEIRQTLTKYGVDLARAAVTK